MFAASGSDTNGITVYITPEQDRRLWRLHERTHVPIAQRGKTLWIRYRNVDGKWQSASTGYKIGQERLAQATYDEVVARVVRVAPSGEIQIATTVRRYAAEWIEGRQKLDLETRAGYDITCSR